VSDPWSERPSNPNASWRTVVGGVELASAFGLPDVARLDLRDRTIGNGVDVATATSSSGVVKSLDGETLRAELGLKSTTVRHLGGRISGGNRYEVAANVAKRIASSASVVIASGESAALFDASVSGPLSATLGGPLLLTTKTGLPAATLAELDRRKDSLTSAVIVGGAGSVSENVLTQLRQRYPNLRVERIGGASRYDVARNVALEIKSHRAVGAVIVASGVAIADALGASGPASALYQPILLTRRDGLPAETSQALRGTAASVARIVGGTASVSAQVEQQLRDQQLTVGRLGGANRYEVAANVATYFRPNFSAPSEIIMTSGSDAALADSLAAGSLKQLMVLTSPTGVPEETLRVFQTTPTLDTVTVVGGPASVPAVLLSRAQHS
jgi:putative cell wall-binding protein